MLRFGAQIAKISNRRKYPLYGITKSFYGQYPLLSIPIPDR